MKWNEKIKRMKRELKLTDAHLVALNRIKLGGIEALRTPTYSVSGRTVKFLVDTFLIDRNGKLTDCGKSIADAIDCDDTEQWKINI